MGVFWKILFYLLSASAVSGCGNLKVGIQSSHEDLKKKDVFISIPSMKITEGSSLLVILNSSESLAPEQGSLQWTLSGNSPNNHFVATTGNATLSGYSGTFLVASKDDLLINGTRSFTLSLELSASSNYTLKNAHYTVEIEDNDITAAPTITVNPLNSISLANVGAYSFSGACSENSRPVNISITDSQSTVINISPAPVCSNNTWTLSGADLSALSDGTAAVEIVHTNEIGATVSTNQNLYKDATAPSAPLGLQLKYSSLLLDHTGPIILSNAGTDAGIGLEKSQLRLVHSDGTIIRDWFDNGTFLTYAEDDWFGFKNVALTSNEQYKIQARSIDKLGNTSTISEHLFTAKMCPSNYVAIYPLSSPPSGNFPEYPYPSTSFCVAKFEMKAVDGSGNLVNGGNGTISYSSTYIPSSRSDGAPWVRVSRNSASNECQSIGQNLITNGQWQTIARHIASTDANWSLGQKFNGTLNIGNYLGWGTSAVADGLAFSASTAKTLAASSSSIAFSDNNDYAGVTDPSNFALKRTHILPWGGPKLWDLGGNAMESVRDIAYANAWVTQAATTPVYNLPSDKIDYFGLNGTFTNCLAPDQGTNLCHLGLVLLPSASDAWNLAIHRGSHYANGHDNGLFKVDGMDGTTDTSVTTGFRCVIDNP